MRWAVLHGQFDDGALCLGRFGLEEGQLPLLGNREDLGRFAFAGGVALAKVPVDHDPHDPDPDPGPDPDPDPEPERRR